MVAILRRRAAMSRAVRPRPDARALWLLAGHLDLETSSLHRAPPLDEDFADGLDEAENEVDDGEASLHEGVEGGDADGLGDATARPLGL